MLKNVIGIDVGGSKISGIVYDGKKIARELTIVTPKDLKDFKTSVQKLLEFLSFGKNIDSVGVGIAGVVDIRKGVVENSPNMKFLQNFKAIQFIKDLGFKRVLLENDANCFAIAESELGKGKKAGNLIAITLGTGIGSGIVLEGQLYRGSHGSAGEVGHVMSDIKYDCEHYFQAARDKKDFKKMGEVLGILFANIINVLDVDTIVLGGTVSIKHGKQFLPEALATAKVHIVNKNAIPKVHISNLKNSGALGAALLMENL